MPMSPARDGRTVYLHCARVGEKLSLLKHNPKVALTAVSYYKAVSAEYTMSYASAVLRGQASIVEDDAERIRALRCISENTLAQTWINLTLWWKNMQRLPMSSASMWSRSRAKKPGTAEDRGKEFVRWN